MSQWYHTLDAQCQNVYQREVNLFFFKIWWLCESDGYPYPIQICQVKQSNAINQPLVTRIISNMVSLISSNSNVLYRQLYFDNFLTNDPLMIELSERSVGATGTIRQKQKGRTNNLFKAKSFGRKKEAVMEDDYCSGGKIYIAKWHDNSVVNIANNWENHEPVRKSKAEEKGGAKEVSQPHLINLYNKSMGGVNLMDGWLKSYRSAIRGKNGAGPCS